MLLFLCLLLSRPLLRRAVHQHVAATLACVAFLLAGASTTLFLVSGPSKRDLVLERQALDARSVELLTRVALPGSPLACLDGSAGEVVEMSCEKLLFASPEATAAAVSYVSAQLNLLVDYGSLGRQAGMSEPANLVSLRRLIEADRFGLVAQVLAGRDGCTPSRCETLALLNDARQVRSNLAGRRFDSYVARYAAAWVAAPGSATPAGPSGGQDMEAKMSSLKAPVTASVELDAPSSSSQPTIPIPAGGASPARPLRPDIFLPSAASIPPVSIMNPEPRGPAEGEPAGSKAAPPAAAKGTATSAPKTNSASTQRAAAPRKPARSSDQARSLGDTNATQSVPLTAAVSQ